MGEFKESQSINESSQQLGSANRYENALISDKGLAEKINQEAEQLVNKAETILEKIKNDPTQENLHSDISGGRWNIHYLGDIEEKLESLYGSTNVAQVQDISKKVKDYIGKWNVYKFHHNR